MLLLMTVEPGFGGQPFIDRRAAQGRAGPGSWSRPAALDVWLQVDGGVSDETIERCAEAGADVFVAGWRSTAPTTPPRQIARLRELAGQACRH